MFANLIAATMLLVLPSAADGKNPEIEARWWTNNPVFRLNDRREIILFFFDPADRRSGAMCRDLNRLARRPDQVVIGLTSSSRRDVERFAKTNRVRFTLGAGSRSAEAFDVRELPALRRISGNDRTCPQPVRLEPQPIALETIKDLTPPGAQLANTGEVQDGAALEQIIGDSGVAERTRTIALKRLWEVTGPEDKDDFVDFLDAQLELEGNPWVRGAFRYYRDVANGAREPEAQARSPSTQNYVEFRSSPEQPEWALARAFRDKLDAERPATPALLAEFARHGTPEPNDLVIRRLIVDAIHTNAEQGGARRVEARSAFMQILGEGETDFSIRLYATMGLGKSCDVGDTEAADLLDALAQNEPQILNVRPTMEYTSYYLRTGNEEAEIFDPPAQLAGPGRD